MQDGSAPEAGAESSESTQPLPNAAMAARESATITTVLPQPPSIKDVAASSAAVSPPNRWKQFTQVLVRGARLMTFLPPRDQDDNAPWWLIGVFALLSLLTPPVFNLIVIGLDGRLDEAGLPSALVHLPLLALAVGVMAYATHTVTRLQSLLLAALVVFFWVDVLVYLTWMPAFSHLNIRNPELLNLIYYQVTPAWPMLTTAVLAVRLSPRAPLVLLPALAAGFLLWTLPWIVLQPDRQLWLPPLPERNDLAPTSTPADEERLYRHAELLQQHLDALQAGQPGVVELYSLAVAGDGSQDVFLREVTKVTALMEADFGAQGRTLVLANSRHTHDSLPLASVTAVERSLKAIAAKMNRDEDILFLFLTSHGSSDHRFQLSNWPVKFQELTPQRLRALLDDAGVRHRVLVVSACYSGGFVDALKNDDTLVLTAAAVDRTSFGCSNEAEWTYFGKAYFGDALPRTHSFIGAFEAAQPAIEKREQAEGHKPSQPQIHIGANIRSTLAAFEQQFKR